MTTLVSSSVEAHVTFEKVLQIGVNRKWHLAEACIETLTKRRSFLIVFKQNRHA